MNKEWHGLPLDEGDALGNLAAILMTINSLEICEHDQAKRARGDLLDIACDYANAAATLHLNAIGGGNES